MYFFVISVLGLGILMYSFLSYLCILFFELSNGTVYFLLKVTFLAIKPKSELPSYIVLLINVNSLRKSQLEACNKE